MPPRIIYRGNNPASGIPPAAISKNHGPTIWDFCVFFLPLSAHDRAMSYVVQTSTDNMHPPATRERFGTDHLVPWFNNNTTSHRRPPASSAN